MRRNGTGTGTRERRLGRFLALGLALAAAASRADTPETVTLQLRWRHQFQFAGYYAAVERGFYREAGLNVKIVEARPNEDVVATVLKGEADFGVGTSDLLLRRAHGEPVVALAVVFQHSPLAFLARRGPDLNTVQDLAGKRVAMPPGVEALAAYLVREGVPLRSLVRVPAGFDLSDLAEGRVDAISAYVTDQPFEARAAGLDTLIFTPRAAGIDFYGDNLFTSEARIRRGRKQVKAFVAASLRGWTWALAHPDETVELILSRYGTRHSREHLRFEAAETARFVQADLVEPGFMNPGRWRHIADTYAELGMMPADYALKGFLWDPDPKVDRRWLYRVLAATLVAALVFGLVLLRISGLNRRLRREVGERRVAEEKLRGLLDQPTVGIFIAQGGRVVYANSRFSEIFGYAVEEVVGGLDAADLVAEADREKVRESVRRALRGEAGTCEIAFAAVRKDGALVEVEMNGRTVDFEGRPAVVGVALDVTEQNRARRQLNFLAFYDPLTELPNRALFYDRLGQALVRGNREREPFALLMLDLDGFKAVNDLHGHETGDALLQAVARRLRTCVRESDTVARLGGDEFVVLVMSAHAEEAAGVVAGKILEALSRPFLLGERECRVGASIGICVSPEDGEDMEILLGRADAAMYESKAKGKNRFTRHNADREATGAVKTLHLDLAPELSTGVAVIDQQHARMASLLNRVADAVTSGEGPERVGGLLDELVAFTRHHFETEQRLMERHGYPEALAHAQEHRRLLDDLISIRAHADGASVMLTLQSLKEWLTGHIAHGDRELGEALSALFATRKAGPPGRPPG